MPREPKFVDASTQFFGSGSVLLDLALGGGWAHPRIFNIVGDKSSGKTLQAIEAFANFKLKFPGCRMRYAETEAAFDDAYATILGFPDEVERLDKPIRTVSQFEKDFYHFMKKDDKPCLYILDSLDAISTDTEVDIFNKKMNDEKAPGSMGAEKAKELSAMFKDITMEMKHTQACLGIISQIRDKIGFVMGETKTRTGGRALDFYASQIVWLAEIKKNDRTAHGVKRIVSVDVEANVKKLKVGMPFRRVKYTLVFGYGVDDEISMLNWMKENKQYDEATYKALKNQVETAREKQDWSTLTAVKEHLKEDVTKVWKMVEAALAPPIKKYGNPVVSPPPSTPPPPPIQKDPSLTEVAEEAKEAIDKVVADIEEKKAGLALKGVGQLKK